MICLLQDQWKKKKQTKAEAAAAQRAKLDPDSAKSAKDVMDERARKRKLEEIEESDVEGVEKELPKQGLKIPQEKKAKKQKTSDLSQDKTTTDESKSKSSKSDKAVENAEAKRQKAERKKGKQLRKAEKKKKQKAAKAADQVVRLPTDEIEIATEEDAEDKPVAEESVEDSEMDAEDKPPAKEVVEDSGMEDTENLPEDKIEPFEAEGLEEGNSDAQNPSASPSPSPPSPTFDNPTEPSANTSTSSVIPPATAPKHIKLPTDPELLRARLAARIEALRAARKADGPDGAPARNRQELMEARRKKEEQRRAHKKELRLKARLEEDARREAALASARDSPASGIFSPAIQSPENNFSFGRVSFADGQQLSEDLSALRDAPKKKGPQDAATALQASEKKRLRLAGLDEEKRADIEEKDLWLNAKKKAHGEKIRDDTSLLKKTLKRKEKAKKKSEKEWNERKEGVAKGQAIRQKKREENLKKRRDEKGPKGKGKGKGKSGGVSKTGKPKVKSRPGFEGSFGSGKRK